MFLAPKGGKVAEDEANGTSNVKRSTLGSLSKKLLQESSRGTQRTSMLAPSHRQTHIFETEGCLHFLPFER